MGKIKIISLLVFNPPPPKHRDVTEACAIQLVKNNSKEFIRSDRQRNNNLPIFQIWLRRKQAAKKSSGN